MTAKLITKRLHKYRVEGFSGEHLSECLLVQLAEDAENRATPWPLEDPFNEVGCTCRDTSPDWTL
jgi:hypothetical protein